MNRPFDENLTQLVPEMEGLRKHLETLPNDTDWTDRDLLVLEDIRRVSLGLVREVEAIFQDLTYGRAKEEI